MRDPATHIPTAVYEPDWPVMRLLNSYRLVVVFALAIVYFLIPGQSALGSRSAIIFEISLAAYFVSIVGFIMLQHRQRLRITTQFFLQTYIEILCVVAFIYASGGVGGGVGSLLLINIALLSQLSSTRHALLFAAIATSTLLSSELFAALLYGRWAADFELTALLGSLFFATAWLLTVPLRRLMQRELAQPTKNRAVLEAHEIATLNEEIIRELDSGVLVLNAQYQVVLINDVARAMLGAEFINLPVHLGRLCVGLMHSLETNRTKVNGSADSFTVEATGQDILPYFAQLTAGGYLVRIDDHSAIKQQFQQLKLASLGRLSASIAHEIRNPLSAVSHATQLLQESSQMDEVDQQLLAIAQTNTRRINRIIEDVLQLSNRQQIRRDKLDLTVALEDFRFRFENESLRAGSTININVEPNLVAVFDPDHLDQILWNICSNALIHNQSTDINLTITAFHDTPNSTVIDIIDNGQGIADLDRQKLFEPFYSTHHEGCGLGLYIIRELCELNKADILCMESETGAHFRITVVNAQQLAA